MISISFDETHHIKDGKPIYRERYKRVMSFHNGIAPVEIEDIAFFINQNGEKIFNREFDKAYGFYENKSAVKDKSGWFHIDIDGSDLYSKRYSWVGNFNENRCVVKDFNGKYFHINENGDRVYRENYKYTGDYKYGIAVVMREDGKSTHIDNMGNLIHNRYFEELNIFHKGFAIAGDKSGYFHINKIGEALYSKRYKKIEDFYNGSAFATTFDGRKITLQELDLRELEIVETTIDRDKILNENFAYFKYQILFAILKLDILKKIKENSSIELPNISKRLIFRWLMVENIIDKDNRLTELGYIIEDELKDIILYWQDLPFKTSSYMDKTLKSGNESFSQIFGDEYFNFLENSKEYLELSKKINNFYNFDYKPLIKYLNLSNETVCDIGGGDGLLMESIKTLYPNIKPIVADKFINSSTDNSIKIDFLKKFSIKSDIFILSRVLHDWSDERALIVLKNIYNNMTPLSKLYIFETVVPEKYIEDRGITLSFHLLNFLGGYERELKDFNRLLNMANLKIKNIFGKDNLISVIEVIKK